MSARGECNAAAIRTVTTPAASAGVSARSGRIRTTSAIAGGGSGRSLDLELAGLFWQVLAEIGRQVGAQGPQRRVVPAVVPLVRVLMDVVKLALGALVLDRGRCQHGVAPRFLQAVGLTGGRLLVDRAQPAVPVDRP